MFENLLQKGVVSCAGCFSVDAEVLRRYADIVKELRGELSQKEFAKLLGVSQSTIHNWENAKNAPDLDGIEKIARIRGQLPQELLTELYGERAEFSIQERIEVMSDQEVGWLMMLVAKRFTQRGPVVGDEPPT